MTTTRSLAMEVGVRPACEALGVSRASYYRWLVLRRSQMDPPEPSVPSWSLSKEQRQDVLEVLHTDRFVDRSPWAVYAALLDEGIYLCSVRTMYRLLQEQGEVRERRNQLSHPIYHKPELLATGPNQVWSWDITKLKGPVKWTYDYLYVILDLFSRYAVGWMLASRECNTLAQKLIEQSCQKQSVVLKPVQNDQVQGGAIHPIDCMLETHDHPHSREGDEIQDPYPFHIHRPAAAEVDDPISKTSPHELGESFQIDLHIGQIDSAPEPVKSEIEDPVSLDVSQEVEIKP